MNDFEKMLLNASSDSKRAGRALAANVGRLIALLALAVAATVTFTEISVGAASIARWGLELAVYLFCAAVIFFSLEEEGESLGREEEDYKKARGRYESVLCEIGSGHLGALEGFCRLYVKRELCARRAALLFPYGLTEADTERAAQIPDRRKRRILRRAAALRPTVLTPAMLLCGRAKNPGRALRDPGRTRLLRMALRLIPSLLSVLFTVSVALHTKDALDAEAILCGCVRLCTLLGIGLKGFLQGFSFVKEGECLWLEEKCRLLRAFLDGADITDPPFVQP